MWVTVDNDLNIVLRRLEANLLTVATEYVSDVIKAA